MTVLSGPALAKRRQVSRVLRELYIPLLHRPARETRRVCGGEDESMRGSPLHEAPGKQLGCTLLGSARMAWASL